MLVRLESHFDRTFSILQETSTPPAVDDVLDLLMKNGVFNPAEADSQTSAPPQYSQPSAQPMDHSTSEPTVVNQAVVNNMLACTTESQQTGNVYTNSNIDPAIPSQHLSLEELGIDITTFPMDLNPEQGDTNVERQSPTFMDVDSDWLDRLISSELEHPGTNTSSTVNSNSYESLLNNNVPVDPLDLFNMDDNDYKIAAELSWDRVC